MWGRARSGHAAIHPRYLGGVGEEEEEEDEEGAGVVEGCGLPFHLPAE